MEFDFSNESEGTAALNTNYVFDMASIFFDFGSTEIKIRYIILTMFHLALRLMLMKTYFYPIEFIRTHLQKQLIFLELKG